MKRNVGLINATPSKRLFLSIIADYDLNRAISELIDNALDIWLKNKSNKQLDINVVLNADQQIIRIEDNGGGVSRIDLKNVVSPGHTSNQPDDEIIGIFGVGTKRAVVALAQEIRIISRHKKDNTFRIEFDDHWLETDSWDLHLYQVDDIQPNTTLIELQRLRLQITGDIVEQLREHLGATYARFLGNKKIRLKLNGVALKPTYFEQWAYPPKYPPHRYNGTLHTDDGKEVKVQVVAGLINESSPTGGEYGVYFYCNDRLIARGLKSYDVGFAKGLAGHPHPSIALARVIVSLKGAAGVMPWNSSKSGINPKHPIFTSLRAWLVSVVKDFASLSRRLEGQWPQKVFKYKKGKVKIIQIKDIETAKTSYLPPLPKAKPRYADIVIQANKEIVKTKPWTKGLYEGIIAVDMIYYNWKFEQNNRIALIILDSTLEIAMKEYLVNDSGEYYSDAKIANIFKQRNTVEAEVQKHLDIPEDIWKKIRHYYGLRNKLTHERATVGIADSQITDYRGVVEKVLDKLFKLKFS